MDHDYSPAVPPRTHQIDWIFFKTIRVRFGKFVDVTAWAPGKESPASQVSVVLSEWVVPDPKFPEISPLTPTITKAVKNSPSVCAKRKPVFFKMASSYNGNKPGEFLEPLAVIRNSAVKYEFVLIWFSDTRWVFPLLSTESLLLPGIHSLF